MADDFCLIHGYEYMKTQFGNPIAYCQACEEKRDLISEGEKQAAACHCGKDGHALSSVNCPVHGYMVVPTADKPTAHVEWTDADYRDARDCMYGILCHGESGYPNRSEFDNAFQHAVGILSLTARHLPGQPQGALDRDVIAEAICEPGYRGHFRNNSAGIKWQCQQAADRVILALSRPHGGRE